MKKVMKKAAKKMGGKMAKKAETGDKADNGRGKLMARLEGKPL